MDTNSFYSSAVAAGVNDDLIPPFAQAFAYDFDFQREITPGDVFEAVFEQRDRRGAAVGAGKLLFVSLETRPSRGRSTGTRRRASPAAGTTPTAAA